MQLAQIMISTLENVLYAISIVVLVFDDQNNIVI
jgi:hypothetical protein